MSRPENTSSAESPSSLIDSQHRDGVIGQAESMFLAIFALRFPSATSREGRVCGWQTTVTETLWLSSCRHF